MISVYVIGCGGVGGYIIDMLPMAIASVSLDIIQQGKRSITGYLENAGQVTLPSIADRLVLIDGDIFDPRNALRQGAGSGHKLNQRMRSVDNTMLRKTYLRNMKLIGYPAYAKPENFNILIPKTPEHNEDNATGKEMLGNCYPHIDSSVVFLCVDNLKTRFEVSKYMEGFDNCLVINGGNEKTTGHVTIYERADGKALDPNLYEVYTEVRADADKRPDEVECSAITPEHDQIAVTNSIIANVMLAVFNKWLRKGLYSMVTRKGEAVQVRKNEVLIDTEEFTMSTLQHPLSN